MKKLKQNEGHKRLKLDILRWISIEQSKIKNCVAVYDRGPLNSNHGLVFTKSNERAVKVRSALLKHIRRLQSFQGFFQVVSL